MRAPRPSYANVMATIAVFIALGGSSYALSQVGSRQVANNSLRSQDIRNNSLTGQDVKNESLRLRDLRPGEVATGDQVASLQNLLTAENTATLVSPPYDVLASDLYVQVTSPPAPGNDRTFRLTENGTTVVSCSIAANDQECTDAGSGRISANSSIVINDNVFGTPAPADAMTSVTLLPAPPPDP